MPTSSSDALLAARKDIAIAVLDGQPNEAFGSFEHRFVYEPKEISLTPARWAPYDAANPVAVTPLGQRVVRRTVGLPTKAVNIEYQPEAKLYGQKETLAHGPFLDSVGRQVYLDVFQPSPSRAFALPGGDPVYMYTTGSAQNTSPFTIALGKGTVWIRADMFTKSNPIETQAPPDVYFGLAIESGRVTTPPMPTSPRGVTLKLAGGPVDLEIFSVQPIVDVSFSFSRVGLVPSATVTSLGAGSAKILGSSFNLQHSQPIIATYLQSMGRLNFSMTADNATVKHLPQLSKLLESTGESKVESVAWSVLAKIVRGGRVYEMPDSGGFAFDLTGSSKAHVQGDDVTVSLNAFTMLIDPGSLTIRGSGSTLGGRSRTMTVGNTSLNMTKAKSTVTFQPLAVTRYFYEALSSGTESWTVVMDMAVAMNQPRTVNNDRVPITCRVGGETTPWSTLTCFYDPSTSGLILNVQANNSLQARNSTAYALKNLLVKADPPATVDMSGRYKSEVLVAGALTMVSFLRYTLPFLPDPYVSNFEVVPDAGVEKNGMGYLTVSNQWTDEETDALDISMMTGLPIPARTMERVDDSEMTRIRSRGNEYWGLPGEPSFHQREIVNGIIPDLGVGQLVHGPNGSLDPDPVGKIFHPPTLLDVSSNSSQFGLVFATRFDQGRRSNTLQQPATSFSPVEEFNISGLMLYSAASNVRVMTLPAVQWEAVLDDQPPNEVYKFTYSGPSTQIAMQDGARPAPLAKLIPISPDEAIAGLVGSFSSTAPISVAARSSLPFGMVSLINIKNDVDITRTASKLNIIDFTLGDEEDPITKLKSPRLQPAHQLRFTPPGRFRILRPLPTPNQPRRPLRLVGSEDPSFAGRTLVLRMGVGPPNPPSPPGPRGDLLDPATTTFNKDMQDKVPLLRLDISGYGATVFSDWKRVLGPADDTAGITHVLMNAFSGRTSREVIEIQTVMAPFAVTVTKTVEIKRLNSGIVVRHEGDWQAASDGRYFYKNAGIITHPGIIKRRYELVDGGNIRTITGVQLVGCVFLTSDGGQDLSNADGPLWYASTLQQLNLGGRIDTVVRIGTSGQRKRLTSIEVKSSSTDANPAQQFAVVAAMGSPIFMGGGQWSFAMMRSNDPAKQPQPIDFGRGVPLVKSGTHDLPDLLSLATPYLFRDPQDLLTSFPATTYNIIHGAASHRVLFASPEIPFVQDAQNAGFAVAETWVADSLALGKSASIFPSLSDYLPGFPTGLPTTPKQLLGIVADQGYNFEVPHLQLPDAQRIIKNDAAVQTVAQAIKDGNALVDGAKQLSADVLAAKTSINVAINTVSNISKLDVTNLHMVTKTVDATTAAVKDASRTIGRLSSDVQKVGGLLGADPDLPDIPGIPKAVEEVKHVFGSALEQVQKSLSFLENLKFLPHFKVSMTNEWGMTMSTSMNRDDLLGKLQSQTKEAVGRIIESFDILISATTSLAAFLLKMHIGITIKIPTGVGPVVALGSGKFDVALGTAGVEVLLELGFGIGVDLSVGPFSASASYTQSQSILVADGVFGLGITAVMRAHVNLVVASADLYLEAKLLVVGGSCRVDHEDHGGTTIWAYARVKIALHVSIFLVCNIGYEEETHWDSNLNGGECSLDNITDLIPS